jgi:enediyne biosynthesis protein E4
MQRIDIRPEPLPVGAIDNRPQYSRDMLFLNRGDDTFAEIACLSGLEAAEWAWTPIFLDVDLDGYEDLLVANGFERDNMNVDVLMRIEAAKAQRKLETPELLGLRSMFPRLDTPNLAFRNLGNLRFAECSTAWGFGQKGISQGMIAADLDQDGDMDIIVNNLNGPAFILRNDGAAPRIGVRLKGRALNTRGIGARIRVLGGPVEQSQEIMAGGRYQSCDDAARSFACGSASRLTIEVAWHNGLRTVFTNALPNHIYEFDEAAAAAGPSRPPPPSSPSPMFADVSEALAHKHAEEPFDDFERQPLLPRKLSQAGPGVSWFDVNQDGRDDLIIGSGRGGQMAVFLNDGKGGFQRQTGGPFDQPVTRDQTTVLGWRTPEGRVSLLAGSSNHEDGQSDGGAARSYSLAKPAAADFLPGRPDSTGPMAMADVDGDGELELFVGGAAIPGRYPAPASSLVFRLRGGRPVLDEAAAKVLASVGLVNGAVFTDLDGDGDPDLVVACDWGPLRVFGNEKGVFTELTTQLKLDRLTGWWNGVTAGDFDGDGRMDLLASNWGRNTKYENWRTRPLRLYHADLDQNGTCDIVEAYFDPAMAKMVPSQQFHVIGAAMPALRERLGTWQNYASLGVQEIWGDALGKAGLLEAACLETTLFLNRGDHFEAHELAIEAQMAPAFSVTVADFDGDGREDVFLSQNFFAGHIDTPRLDSGRGLLLRGDGRGGLSPVPGQESGMLVYGEQRGAAVADYDGDGRVDLAVSQNAAATRLFHNLRARPGLRVRLAGPPGNPQGVGAILRLEGPSGVLGPAREIHAGSGYWSQDSAVQVMCAEFTPAKLRVRWPGGKETVSAIPEGAREIEVDLTGRVTAKSAR